MEKQIVTNKDRVANIRAIYSELTDEQFEALPPLVQNGTESYGDWLRYERCKDFSVVGQMLGLKTVNETIYWVHAEDIKGIEEQPDKAYQSKMFVQGKTSPVFVVVDMLSLLQTISFIRSNE